MKTCALVIAILLSSLTSGRAQADNEAIKQVLRNETEGFFKRDKKVWSDA